MKSIWSRIASVGVPVLIMVLVVACTPAAAPPPAPGSTTPTPEVFSLKLQALTAPGEMWRTEMYEEMIEEMSGGRIQIESFSSGEFVPMAQAHEALVAGALDIAITSGAYYSDWLPLGAVESGLPFGTTVPGVDVYIPFWEMGLLDLCREAYAQKGIYFLAPIDSGPYALIATEPTRNLSDLRKLRIRATSVTAKALDSVGVSTVYLPPEECYTGLATGTIDGIILGAAALYRDNKIYEVAKYYVQPPVMSSFICNILINLELWESLPPDLQSIFQIASYQFNQYLCYSYIFDEYEALEEMGRQGLKIVNLDEETVAELTQAAVPLWDELGTDPMAARGVEIWKEWFKLQGKM